MTALIETYIAVFTIDTSWSWYHPFCFPCLPPPIARIILSLSLSAIIYHHGMPNKWVWKSGTVQFTILSFWDFLACVIWTFFSHENLDLSLGWWASWLSPWIWQRLSKSQRERMLQIQSDKDIYLAKWFQTWTLDSDYLGSNPGPTIYHLPNLGKSFDHFQ